MRFSFPAHKDKPQRNALKQDGEYIWHIRIEKIFAILSFEAEWGTTGCEPRAN
jgi:hypothetical protein